MTQFARASLEICKEADNNQQMSPPEGLQQSVTVLHGLLPNLKNNFPQLQKEICLLCEIWYKKEFPNRESLVANALNHLLDRCLSSQSIKADVKRIWNLREALFHLRLQDGSANDFKKLLLKSITNKSFICTIDGVKFAAFLFGITPSFVDDLNTAIRAAIPGSTIAMANAYGEIYHKAWRSSSGLFREKIEQGAIQHFMYHGILANRKLPKQMELFGPIFRILDTFHRAKNDRQLQGMICRLYEPILWRNFSVANAMVRANAIELLSSAFPVENPDGDAEDRGKMQENQYKILTQSLMDENPEVRMASINGVCRISAGFWPIVPPEVLNKWLKSMIKDLVYDASSPKVRLSVIQGLKHLVANCPRSHPVLQKVLPRISDVLHDINEQVRIAMIDLLIEVKKIRTIAYFKVCPMDHLLARMEVDSKPGVVRRIAGLILNSFFPNGQNEAQFDR